MSLQALLNKTRLDQEFLDKVTAWERLPARPARYVDCPDELDHRLRTMLHKLALLPLYTHQVQAIEAVMNGQNVVLATGTASGKSLAYHLPTLQFILNDPQACALYIFPTKALAQDQAVALTVLIEALDPEGSIALNTYDGDTPSEHRYRVRREGGVIISNPDMLHLGILPHHIRWAHFFRNLRVVVLDELHSYRGIFGSHVANVLRRLHRICKFHGSSPIFICSSATIANPNELAERLIEAQVTLVDDDGSPRGEKHIILYNPPPLDIDLGLRRGYTLDARDIAHRFLAEDVQTVVFARTRLMTEILLTYTRDALENGGNDPNLVRGYRGGYLPQERREIERGLRNGKIRGVVATNALELGVDIGELDAAVLAGYPGTIASTWQQFGRAGRRNDVSVGVLVASSLPLDQYIVKHPVYLFERPPEHALINPDNLTILAEHLRCAIYELPLGREEAFGTCPDLEDILSILVESGEVQFAGGNYRWVSDVYPAGDVNLRTSGGNPVAILDCSTPKPQIIGQVDRSTAPITAYAGAIYLHEGRQFAIDDLDWEGGIAHAHSVEVNHYTVASSMTEVRVQNEYKSAQVGDCFKSYGWILVTQQATGYKTVQHYSHAILGTGEIDLPPQQFETIAYWIAINDALKTRLEDANVLLRPNNYGPNWAQQRDLVRSRDRYRCVQCGVPEGEDRQHDVHHIQPFREFGYIPGENETYLEANCQENLVTLCRRCHHTVEAVRGTRSALGGLAQVLRNVATLFLMCSPGDIGVLAEPRSAHTQAPTITIYDFVPGGLGLSARLYDLHSELLAGALDMIRDCECSEGCPACVGPGSESDAAVSTKELTTILLTEMVDSPDGILG